MPHERDVLITGIGLISCLGEGTEAPLVGPSTAACRRTSTPSVSRPTACIR